METQVARQLIGYVCQVEQTRVTEQVESRWSRGNTGGRTVNWIRMTGRTKSGNRAGGIKVETYIHRWPEVCDRWEIFR